MRKIIMLLSIAVFGFAGYTVWNDPTIGPQVQAMVPDSVTERFPVIASMKTTGGAPSGNYGGIGAANTVTGAIVGSVSN